MKSRLALVISAMTLLWGASCEPTQEEVERSDKEARAAEIVAQYDNRKEAEEACEEQLDPGFLEGYCHDAAGERFGEQKERNERPGRFIEGLTAADVTINMEQAFGFRCDGPHDAKSRVYYSCRSPEDPGSYVGMYGMGSTEIENIAAFSSSFPSDLLSYVATIPYEGARPAQVKRWVLSHLRAQEAHLTVGTARFSMFDGQLLEINAIRSRFGSR